jgi:hypothetical protein
VRIQAAISRIAELDRNADTASRTAMERRRREKRPMRSIMDASVAQTGGGAS